jgi:TonB family protein
MKESRMPSTRVALCVGLVALAIVAGLTAQSVTTEPGPLEKRANAITPENPLPRRTGSVVPAYPAEAAAVDATAMLTFRVTLDESGRLGEIRQLNTPVIATPAGAVRNPAAIRAAGDALTRSAIAALRQWTYDAPANAPIAFSVTFSFRPGAEPTVAQDTSFRPPPPPPPPGAPRTSTAPPPPPPGAPVRVGGQIRPPTQLRRVDPVYPPDALASRTQGVVILEAVIAADGTVSEARILRSIPALNEAAIDAVKQWMYIPTLLNGTPVPVIMTVTVQFTLPPAPTNQ